MTCTDRHPQVGPCLDCGYTTLPVGEVDPLGVLRNIGHWIFEKRPVRVRVGDRTFQWLYDALKAHGERTGIDSRLARRGVKAPHFLVLDTPVELDTALDGFDIQCDGKESM